MTLRITDPESGWSMDPRFERKLSDAIVRRIEKEIQNRLPHHLRGQVVPTVRAGVTGQIEIYVEEDQKRDDVDKAIKEAVSASMKNLSPILAEARFSVTNKLPTPAEKTELEK